MARVVKVLFDGFEDALLLKTDKHLLGRVPIPRLRSDELDGMS